MSIGAHFPRATPLSAPPARAAPPSSPPPSSIRQLPELQFSRLPPPRHRAVAPVLILPPIAMSHLPHRRLQHTCHARGMRDLRLLDLRECRRGRERNRDPRGRHQCGSANRHAIPASRLTWRLRCPTSSDASRSLPSSIFRRRPLDWDAAVGPANVLNPLLPAISRILRWRQRRRAR